MIGDTIFSDNGLFYFKDEFWDSVYGPFYTIEEARGEFERYKKSMPFMLNNIKMPCSFCGSDKYTTTFDVEDAEVTDRVHVDRCECGAFRTRVDRDYMRESRKLCVNGWELPACSPKLIKQNSPDNF